MMTIKRNTENGWIWALKQASGVLVIILILVHLVVNHLVAENGLMSFKEVVAYLGNPWIAGMEITFLVIVIGHSLLGLRSVILDFNPPLGFIKVLDPLLIAFGVIAAIYGIWLTIVVGSLAL